MTPAVPSPTTPRYRGLGLMDLVILVGLCGLIYAMVEVAREWTGQMQPIAEIHLDVRHLPLYVLHSLARGLMAYGLSFVVTIAYGHAMARIDGAERVLMPLLDILQSIPVLGFLPGLVLALVHLFPHDNLGLELASVFMIFTGQVWNMTFSYHRSLRSIPPELTDAARLAHLTAWQRFWHLDLPHAATGLVWNSMMSMAGGWFFLTVSESFVLGRHDFRLPGLGSYMSVAIERGDAVAQVLGVLAMAGMIVLLDQLLWRPLLAWSHKFSDEEGPTPPGEWLVRALRGSVLLRWVGAKFHERLRRRRRPPVVVPSAPPAGTSAFPRVIRQALAIATLVLLAAAAFRFVRLLGELDAQDWTSVGTGVLLTFGRVLVALTIASLWALPAGVWIGCHPLWSRRLQPVIQLVASFPAPMLYPLALAPVLAAGGGLGLGSIVLLMLGTQWYVLFNVIAGASSIPRELWEVARLGRLTRVQRWRRLILPAVFPSLLTGWITAMGGAWNASIVAEFLRHRGRTLSTPGLGSLISQATEDGRFALLAAAVAAMALTVVAVNRFVWRPLGHLAENRYRLDA